MNLEQLSKAVGVELKVRDNKQLIEDTNQHLLKQLLKKNAPKINAGSKTSTANNDDAIREFYEKANRID